MNLGNLIYVLAAVLYSGEIVLSARGFKDVPSIVMTMIIAFGIGFCTLPFAYQELGKGGALGMINGWQWLLLLIIVAMSFLADWCHFSAVKFNKGPVGLATFYMLIPVFCSVFHGQKPSLKTIAAWIFGAIALWLIMDEIQE